MTLTLTLLGTALLCPLAAVLGWRAGRSAGWPAALGLLGLAGALVSVWANRGDTSAVSEVLPWMPALDVGLALRLDGLSLFFGLLVLVIGAVVLAYSAHYLHRGQHGAFYGLMTFFAAAMLGLVLADDVVVMFVMWELTTLCSFVLIARSGPTGAEPAIRTLLVTVAGGLCLLTAVVILWLTTGTTTLSEILTSAALRERPGVAAAVAALVAVAAFTKSAQFPFHGWLPDAMVAITPVSAYLHAAAMVKAGIYLLLRFSPAFAEVAVWNGLLIAVGLITAVMGAVFALQRHDLKELLAYSTVSQLGFLVATIGIGTGYAIVGAIVHTAAHALFKSALFMSVGIIDHNAGTRDIRRLRGLAHAMPVTSTIMALAALSMAAVPPLFGFISKEAMFKAMAVAPLPAPVVVLIGAVAVGAAALTFAYAARMLTVLPGRSLPDPPREASPGLWSPVALVSGAGLVLGVAGPLAEPLLGEATTAVAGAGALPDLALWHGWSPELFMSLAVFALGGMLVLGRRRVDRALDRRLLPWTAVGVVDGLRAGSISLGHRVGDVTRSDTPFRHLLAPVLGVVVIGAVGISGIRPDGSPPAAAASDWVLFGAVALSVLLGIGARTRIALVTVVGVAGFAMALYFFTLGAVDVALTQMLVEILTVAVIVLLLTRLPITFHRTERHRVGIAAGAAILAAVVAGVGTWALTGRRPLSPAGEFYLTEGEELTGGTNVVNTILVDFRALDTLGELTVLAVAGLAVIVALEARGLLPRRPSPIHPGVGARIRSARDNTMTIRVAERLLGPVIIVLSLYFLLRGHNAPGGGFISALILSAGLALTYLAAPDDRVSRMRLPYVLLIGGGVFAGTAVGLWGFAGGSFLRPLHFYIGDIHVTTALLFDVGVYLAVAGVILTAISKLGITEDRPTPLRRPDSYAALARTEVGTTTDQPHDPATQPRLATVGAHDRTRDPRAAIKRLEAREERWRRRRRKRSSGATPDGDS